MVISLNIQLIFFLEAKNIQLMYISRYVINVKVIMYLYLTTNPILF